MIKLLKVAISQIWNIPSRVGDHYGIDWLIYNPGVFFEFAMVARRNAPLFVAALTETFSLAHSYNDVGCGTGQFVRQLRIKGKACEGFEYSGWGRAFGLVIGVKIHKFDLCSTPPISGLKRASIAYSLEVGEHVPAQLAEVFVKTLIEAGEIVVFTAAPPGQVGHGHINCQSKQYWADLFFKFDYIRLVNYENELLSNLLNRPRLSRFLINNLMVFGHV